MQRRILVTLAASTFVASASAGAALGDSSGDGGSRDQTQGLGGDSACLIPGFDGAVFSREWKEALWAKFSTAAPQRRRQSVERYSIVKRA